MANTENDTLSALSNLTSGSANHLRQKRARSQLSCVPCRTGKLKCNRSHDPACDQCIKRNRESSCLYVPPPVKQKATQNVKGRIRQLESLVVDLMKQSTAQAGGTKEQRKNDDSHDTAERDGSESNRASTSEATPPSDADASPSHLDSTRSDDTGDDIEQAMKPFGQMRISKNEISYVGDTHWQAILNGISDLKRDLGDEEDECEEDDDIGPSSGNGAAPINRSPGTADTGPRQPGPINGLAFMLGHGAALTRDQLIAAVPDKKVADRLLSLWFNSPDPFKPIIHAPTFQEEYRNFWKSPTQTPVMWLGLLFSILSLAASFGLRDADPTTPVAQKILTEVDRYHTLAASAAVLADFTKPRPHTLECLILYAAGLRSNDAFVNVWLMIGLTGRLALRMGYHRDPSSYPQISVFDGEMRRRVWAVISMIDVLISFQLGLPSMVKALQSDTQPPRNLLDRDFNPSTKLLPPGRGIDELTPSSYTRAKLGITRVFAEASELSHATVPPAYEVMLELDRQLELAKSQVPPLLQMPDISELVTDPAEQLMCRFNLDLLYLKTKIVLHRRYMEKPFSQLSAAEQATGIGESRKACTSAGVRVLHHHHTIYTATQPGGQLESVKWYMGSISTHDFLLAAMVVCLELSQQIRDDPDFNPYGIQCPYQGALMDALEKSQKIWSEASDRKRKLAQFSGELGTGDHMFDETEKASRAMAVMIAKVKAAAPRRPLTQLPPQPKNNVPLLPSFPTSHLQPVNPNMTFTGIQTMPPWTNLDGVPPTIGRDGASWMENRNSPEVPHLSHSDGHSNNNSSSGSPEDSFGIPSASTQPEFSMIGNMLDVQGSLDWEMWDMEINNASMPSDWSGMNLPNMALTGTAMDTTGLDGLIAPGEPATSAAESAQTVDESATSPASRVYPGSWMSFQDMKNVSFDIDLGQINPDFAKPGYWSTEPENQWNVNGMN